MPRGDEKEKKSEEKSRSTLETEEIVIHSYDPSLITPDQIKLEIRDVLEAEREEERIKSEELKAEIKEKSNVEISEEKKSQSELSTVEKIIKYLEENSDREVYVKEISEALNMSPRAVRKYLRKLRKQYPELLEYKYVNRRVVYTAKKKSSLSDLLRSNTIELK